MNRKKYSAHGKNRRSSAAAVIGLCLLGTALFGLSACTNRIEVSSGSDASSSGTDGAGDAVITLSENGASVSGTGAKVKGSQVRITEAGTYTVSGTAADIQLYVETSGDGSVTLVFDGVSITNETENALHVEQAEEVILQLADESDNLLQSGTSLPERADDDASGGALYTRDDLTITGTGSLTVNGYLNDGIHANDDLTIESGDLLISAADDGIHANDDLTIKGGSLTVTDSYEGIEGNRIYIKGGNLSLTSSDDGINAYGGQNNLGFGRGNVTQDDAEETPELIIDDGEIYVNAGGDGLDSNGDLIVNGGTILVDGPTNSANGALDSGAENGGTCEIHGGTVLAIGASGMAERFGDSSTQDSFRLKTDTAEGGSEIVITDADGNELFSHTAAKSFSSIVFSCPSLETGEDYTVSIDGESFSFTQTSVSTAVTAQDDSTPAPDQRFGQGGGQSPAEDARRRSDDTSGAEDGEEPDAPSAREFGSVPDAEEEEPPDADSARKAAPGSGGEESPGAGFAAQGGSL